MRSPRHAKLIFASALALLSVAGIAAAITIERLSQTTDWVAHTYQVQIGARGIEATLTDAARARAAYATSASDIYIPQFYAAVGKVPGQLARLKQLTADNSTQQQNCLKLEALVKKRVDVLNASVESHKSGVRDPAAEDEFARTNNTVASQVAGLIDNIVNEEETLLQMRTHDSRNLFMGITAIVGVVFASALLLFWIHYRLLSSELLERERAERNATEAEENARNLSTKLLRLQDEERRRFSRELHDGLGQILLAAKMMVSTQSQADPTNTRLEQCSQLINQAIEETRTISHLLHPPLLEEVGFACAARWYVEGFAERSHIAVSLDAPEDLDRLPKAAELALFRILQESLTNIHRHSRSEKAGVSIRSTPDTLYMDIRDYGKGIPAQTLHNFGTAGANVGVGLVGMKERVREQNGQLEVTSDSQGTLISIQLPISAVKPTGATTSFSMAD